jgi:hypothetical protein
MQLTLDYDSIASRSHWETRDFNDWQQSREWYPDSKRWGRWRFYVSGFNDHDCRVARADGSYQSVPIDSRNRINLDGRWYGPRSWDH